MDELRIVLADDHPVVRDGLCALLASVPGLTVVETVATGREAVRAAVTTAPDVLVLDIRMPDLDGVAAAGEIARVAPKTAVLMLTMFDDDSLFAAMRAGASGYVLKGATQDEIVRAIRAVAAGEAIFSVGIARRMLTYLTGPPRAADPFPELTPREREVLDLVAAGLPNATIGARLGLATIRVGGAHCCAPPPSGPCGRVPAHTAQAGREGGSGWLQLGVPCHRPGVSGTAAGEVYEVCSLTARRGAGRAVVDQVVRLDRLLRHPQEPPLPALGGLGWLVGGQQVLPAQGAPPILLGQQAHGVGVQWGFDLAATLRPVLGQVGVVRGRPALDQGVPRNLSPGRFR